MIGLKGCKGEEALNSNEDCQLVLTDTLRKIGRNLLNYQQVERLWRSHLNIADISTGIDGNSFELKAGTKSERNIPMGWLGENHTKSLFTPVRDSDSTESSKNISLKTSFRVGESGELSEVRRKQVLKIVEERNFLAHKLAEKFDHTSKEGCLDICIKLDEENIRIIEEIEFLKNISSAYQEAVREIQQYIESDEFLNELSKER